MPVGSLRAVLRSVGLLVPLLVPGCGDRAEGPRLEVVVLGIDAPGPDAMWVRPFEGTATHRLVRSPEDGPRVYVAENAPEGPFVLEGSGGWGMLWARSEPPVLRANAPEPAAVEIGRPYTLYLGASAPGHLPDLPWVAEAVDAPDRVRVLEVETERDDTGVVAIRLRREDWKGRIRLMGRIEGGTPSDFVTITAKGHGPLGARVSAATTLPVRVHLAGVAGQLPAARVTIRMLEVPLDVVYEALTRHGEARFGGVPYLDRPLEVSVGPPADVRVVVPPEAWTPTQDLRVLAASERREVRVRSERADTIESVQVRAEDAPSYGLVPFRAEDGAVVFDAPTGPGRAILRAGDAAAEVAWTEAGAPEAATFVRSGTVLAHVPGGVGGRVRFARQEGGRDALLQGGVLAVPSHERVEARLPTGTYVAAFVGIDDVEHAWKTPAVVEEGSTVRLPPFDPGTDGRR